MEKFTSIEVADILGYDVSTINRWAREGKLKAKDANRGKKKKSCWLFDAEEIYKMEAKTRTSSINGEKKVHPQLKEIVDFTKANYDPYEQIAFTENNLRTLLIKIAMGL